MRPALSADRTQVFLIRGIGVVLARVSSNEPFENFHIWRVTEVTLWQRSCIAMSTTVDRFMQVNKVSADHRAFSSCKLRITQRVTSF